MQETTPRRSPKLFARFMLAVVLLVGTMSIYTCAMKGDGLSNADIAWHAVNTFGWDCSKVVARDPKSGTFRGGYFVVTCSNGTKLRVYPRPGQHPRITNFAGGYD